MTHLTWIYHDTEDPKVVDSDECESYFANGWRDHPARHNLPTDEMESLREKAKELGIKVDGRWSKTKLQSVIDDNG